MAYEPEDRDSAVIGRDDQPLQFEGDDVEFPTSPDQYDDKSPTAKHTDFDTSKGTQTVDGVKFDVGSIFKGTTDAVTATAKAVAEVSKAKATSPDGAPKTETNPKTGSTKPSSSPPAPIVKPASSGGTYAVVGFGVLAAATLVAVMAGGKRKRRAL